MSRSFPKFLSSDRSTSNEVVMNKQRGITSVTRLRKSVFNKKSTSPRIFSEDEIDVRHSSHKADLRVMQVYVKKQTPAQSRNERPLHKKNAHKLHMAGGCIDGAKRTRSQLQRDSKN
jgi:hypothetical protein